MVSKFLNAISLLRKRQKFNSQQQKMSKPVHLQIKPLHLTIRKYFILFRLIAGFLWSFCLSFCWFKLNTAFSIEKCRNSIWRARIRSNKVRSNLSNDNVRRVNNKNCYFLLQNNRSNAKETYIFHCLNSVCKE